jgi:isoquinoline 1-oxidoreductase beta subunit
MQNDDRLNRRAFLKIGTLAIGGLSIAFGIPVNTNPLLTESSAERGATVNAYLRIGTDNRIHIILSKVEMGQ